MGVADGVGGWSRAKTPGMFEGSHQTLHILIHMSQMLVHQSMSPQIHHQAHYSPAD
jgi:hypothetical protein